MKKAPRRVPVPSDCVWSVCDHETLVVFKSRVLVLKENLELILVAMLEYEVCTTTGFRTTTVFRLLVLGATCLLFGGQWSPSPTSVHLLLECFVCRCHCCPYVVCLVDIHLVAYALWLVMNITPSRLKRQPLCGIFLTGMKITLLRRDSQPRSVDICWFWLQ